MENVKDIKVRIKSVTETAQITRAMELISASKMQKGSVKYANNRAYFMRVRECLSSVLNNSEFYSKHMYLKKKQGGETYFLIIGSDKGLAGEYNHTLISFATQEIQKVEKRKLFCIGATVYNHFEAMGESVVNVPCEQEPVLEDARIIANDFIQMYDAGEMDEMIIIYTKLITKAVQKPDVIRLLPVLKEDFPLALDGQETKLDFEPDVSSVMKILVPQYILGIAYSCLIESKFNEHLERMRAMSAATENANELINDLQISFNKARQEKITTEITELSSAQLNEQN